MNPINHQQPSELTVRGTIAVRASGYLVGDRVLVRINGVNVGATVEIVQCGRVEVSADLDIVDKWIANE